MWFTSIYLKTLREFRIAILGWGVGMGVLLYAVLAAIPSLVATPAARAAVVSLGSSFSWLAEPIALTSPGGYATWKYGLTILVIAIWPLLVCSRMLRGEEERGSLDALLSLPRGRVRIGAGKAGGSVDGPALDGPAHRAAGLRGRQKRQRGLWSGRCLALWPECNAHLRRLRGYRTADLPVHSGARPAAAGRAVCCWHS